MITASEVLKIVEDKHVEKIDRVLKDIELKIMQNKFNRKIKIDIQPSEKDFYKEVQLLLESHGYKVTIEEVNLDTPDGLSWYTAAYNIIIEW